MGCFSVAAFNDFEALCILCLSSTGTSHLSTRVGPAFIEEPPALSIENDWASASFLFLVQ